MPAIPLRRVAHRGRLAFALALAGLTVPPVVHAQTADTGLGPELVQDLHAVFGTHHARAVHAKGVMLEGLFTPTREARSLSSAAVFAGPTIPVTVRFSVFTGIPDIPDNIRGASPQGFAVRFHGEQEQQLDVVAHSFNGFPVATAREFGALLQALAASGPGVAAPTPLDAFFATHPYAKPFLTAQKPPPQSFATAAYFGVNAVAFIGATGKRMVLRYQFVPAAGEHYLDDAALKARGVNYLSEEVAGRVATVPIRFDWYAQMADPADKAEDPSQAWPDTRRRIRLGTITLQRMAANDAGADKALAFMPGRLPPGIEVVDPMLGVRNQAYPVSARERQ